MLGLSVGVLQMASRTDNGRNAFVVDLGKISPHEDQHQLQLVPRREAYAADITYGTNSEFGFDYLRDNLTLRLEDRVQRGHFFAIVDEVDNVLIDEARTPLIISGPAAEDTEWYVRMAQVVRQLRPEDYEINEKDRTVTLTEAGEARVEEILEMPLGDPERPEDINPQQARVIGHLEKALQAQFLYHRNKEYLVQGGKVLIVDEFTGRLMPGRRWSEGLHQAVEAKEGVRIEPENVTYATITLQNYFRMYAKLSGMTGTAATEGEEFGKIYKLDVQPIITNLEYSAALENANLTTVDAKDEQGYKYTYYAHRNRESEPVFFKRKDYPDSVFRTEEAKLRAITGEIIRFHVLGRPQLVGTTSVEHSERLSQRLQGEPVRRLLQILMLRRAWMEKNKVDIIERPIPEFVSLNEPLASVNPGDLRPVAKSLDIPNLNLEEPASLQRLLTELFLEQEDIPRLLNVIKGGVPHQVLNARKHDEEAQIILRAGEFGRVTIATNMAGRGVDIKLGGQLSEDILLDINRVLRFSGIDPYNMTLEERFTRLMQVPVENYRIYGEQVKEFIEYFQNMERVRALGGLHVIGSERHEARRIDNQLRGRSARQGDPGSSRFYLSLEDDLMRLFGGQQVEGIWKRLSVDDSMPIEMGILGRIVEQSQERVEGSNFDVRKHLLEYDDVLNTQRKRIYEQRDRAFNKSDLSEDILEMLNLELQSRIPTSLKDEDGPWRLIGYLDDVQPPISFESVNFPSFSYRLLIDSLREKLPAGGVEPGTLRSALLDMAGRALEAEKEHAMRFTAQFLKNSAGVLETQAAERSEVLDNFLDGLEDRDEEVPERRPIDILAELSAQTRTQLKLNNDQLRRLPEGDQDVIDELHHQVEDNVFSLVLKRIMGALERRLEEPLSLQQKDLANLPWNQVEQQLLDGAADVFESRRQRLLGDQGQIAHDLDSILGRVGSLVASDQNMVSLFNLMVQGTRLSFDSKSHRRGQVRYRRLRYDYLAAELIQGEPAAEVTGRVLAHLQDGLTALQHARGLIEWNHLVTTKAVLRNLDGYLGERLAGTLGDTRYETLLDVPLDQLEIDARGLVQDLLGERMQNVAYRQLLLQVISNRWVDYLTQVEALRVSIGLEAYAQRDPLVQYKSRASEMFQSLLAEIRMGVIGGLFTFRPARPPETAAAGERERPAEESAQTGSQVQRGSSTGQSKGQKKKGKHR